MTTKRLLKLAKKGDGEAFISLIQNYEEVLYGTAIRLLRNEADVADVLQETTLIAYEKITDLRKPQYFNTWLYRILLNECHKFLRKENKTLEYLEIDSGYEDNHSSLELADLLGELAIIYRVPLTLYYYSGFSIREISELLGEPEGTIKSKLFRGKALLKKEFMPKKEETSDETTI